MKFTFLGTAASNGYPALFCQCHLCAAAWTLGGKNLRKRSAALINDDLLIDLGPDILMASQLHNVPLTNVQYCLQTHPHSDHLALSYLHYRSSGFGVVGAPLLHFYASSATLARADRSFKRDLSEDGLLGPAAEDRGSLSRHSVSGQSCLAV